jgi:hypothetical protein
VVPTSADDVVVGGPHVVAVPSGTAAQCRSLTLSPTAGTTSLTVAAGGSIAVGTPAVLAPAVTISPSGPTATPALVIEGTFRTYGNVAHGDAPVRVNAGGILEMDSGTHGQRIVWVIGTTMLQANAYLVAQGAVGRRCVIRSTSGSGKVNGYFTNTDYGTGHVRLSWCRVASLGDGQRGAFEPCWHDSGGNVTTIDDCLFEATGGIASPYRFSATGTLRIRNTTFRSSTRANLSFGGDGGDRATATWLLERCVFDHAVYMWAVGMRVRSCLFRYSPNIVLQGAEFSEWTGVVYEKGTAGDSTGSDWIWGAKSAPGTDIGPTYVAGTYTGYNPHLLQPTATGIASSAAGSSTTAALRAMATASSTRPVPGSSRYVIA